MIRNYVFIGSFFIPAAFAAEPLNDLTISDINNLTTITQNIQLETNQNYTSDGASSTTGQWLNMYGNNSNQKSLEINSSNSLITIKDYHYTSNGIGTNGSILSSKGNISLIGNYAFLNNTSENTDDGTSSSGTNDIQGGALFGDVVSLQTGVNGSILFENNKILSGSTGTNHQVNAMGGAIRASSLNISGNDGAIITFKNNSINGNSAYGGAIYLQPGAAQFSGNHVNYIFDSNIAQANRYKAIGGAIYIASNSGDIVFNATNSIYKFTNNIAQSLVEGSSSGGAIGTREGGDSPVKIYLNGINSQYIFEDNQVLSTFGHNPVKNIGHGGAINIGGELYLDEATASYVFKNNSVKGDNVFGGAISSLTTSQMNQNGYQAKLALVNTTMDGNSAVADFGGGSNANPVRAMGGAIYAYGSDITIGGNSSFINNYVEAYNAYGDGSQALAKGGAIYATSNIKTIAGGALVAADTDVKMNLVTNIGETITFKDNYSISNNTKTDNDIYWDGAATGGSHTVTIQTDTASKIEMLSSIASSSVANVDINKIGTGTWVLGKASDFAGKTNIAITQGVFELADSNSSIKLDNTNGSTFKIGQAGNLFGNYGTINSDITNSGTIYASNATASSIIGTQGLTINGNYIGNNGLLVLNTVLGDDSSPTERLVIKGNATGVTDVTVNNLGGLGAKTIEGIKIVDVAGTSDINAFKGHNIVAGIYEYSLRKGSASDHDSESWYLTNLKNGDPTIRPEGGSYLANLVAANNIFNLRLHDRLGETQYTDLITGETKVTSMWLRARYGYDKYKDGSGQLSIKNNWNVVQLGGDIAQWSSDSLDRFHLGLMGGYGHSSNKTNSNKSQRTGKSNIDGYSAGIYGTWYSNDKDKVGLYVDSWLQWSKFDATVNVDGASSEKYKLKGLSASVESGYSFLTKQWQDYNLWLQPKGQFTWSDVTANRHIESNGTAVTSDEDMLQSRLGLKMILSSNDDVFVRMNQSGQLFVETNWLHNFNTFAVKMNENSINQAGARNIGEVKLGVEGDIARNTNLWFNIAFQAGDHDYKNASMMLGAKYSF